MKYFIEPTTKPKISERDSWMKRPSVMKYLAFKDEVKNAGIELPDHGFKVEFVLTMPNSWSKKKKDMMLGQPHMQKPTFNNLTRALSEAVFDDDSQIWNCHTIKRWGYKGSISVKGNI